MSDIVRFSVSVENELLEKFDRFCREEQFATLHVHLEHVLCLEVIALRGPAGRLHSMAGGGAGR